MPANTTTEALVGMIIWLSARAAIFCKHLIMQIVRSGHDDFGHPGQGLTTSWHGATAFTELASTDVVVTWGCAPSLVIIVRAVTATEVSALSIATMPKTTVQ